MSVIQVNGTVDNPDEIKTHEEPASPYSGATIPAGVLTQIVVSDFKNTGNVDQVLAVELTNVQGAQLMGFTIDANQTQNTGQATLAPGATAQLRIDLKAPDTGVGPDTEYSFDINTNWT